MKKLLSIFLVIAMLVTTCTVSVSAVTYTDISGHWAENEIEAWSDYGVISGYDGQFSPDRHITRGEFAVVLGRLMGYQKESGNTFSDLPEKFYTSYVLKLYNAGVMQGYEGFIRPEASLTREEASVMICRALGINQADTMNRDFADASDVSSWSKGYINAMVNSGLLNGTDGKLNPQKPITRAEVVKILDNAVYPILKAGTFENVDTGKIVLVSAGEVTIKDSEIAGTVIVTQGATNGNITFTNSKIEKNFVIDNDRSAFIKVNNTTVVNKEILNHKAFITTSSGGGGGSSGGSSGGGNNSGSSDNPGSGGNPPIISKKPKITVGNVSANAGENVTIPVSISENIGLTALAIDIGYNADALTFVGCEQGEALNGLTFTKSGDMSINPITLSWDGIDADATNGNIVLLTFKVEDTAITGDYLIDATVRSACDANVNDVTVTEEDGKLSVSGVPAPTINVTYYEGYGRFAPVIDEVELALNTDRNVTVKASDIPDENLPWLGYEKEDYMPADYADYTGKHEVEPSFWYIDNGEWKHFEENVVLTEDTNVYLLYTEISANALGTAVVVRYDKSSRAMDSMKAFFDKAIPQLETAKEAGLPIYEELSSTLFGIFKNIDWIDDDDGDIKRPRVDLDYLDALVETDVESIREIINNQEAFKITPDTLELWRDISDELTNITFDDILALESNSEMNIMISLLGYEVCEEMFNNVRDSYCRDLGEYIFLVDRGVIDESYFPSHFTMIFNPIDEIFRPLFDEAEEQVISAFDESIRYNENPYLQYLVEDLDIMDELFDRVDRSERDHSGYRLKDLTSYAGFLTKMLIATDDALCWYDDIDSSEYEAVCDAILAKTRVVYNKFETVLNDPAYSDKIPDDIKEAYEFLEQIKAMLSDIKPALMENIGDYIDVGTGAIFDAILSDGGIIQEKLQEKLESGELYTKIEELKNSSMGQNFDTEFIDDLVEVIENFAEHGLDYYRVETTDDTVLDKFEIEIGGRTFSMSRYLTF